MKTHTLHIPYTEDVLLSLKKTKEQFEQDARFFLAVKLMSLVRSLPARLAKLAGIERVAFLLKLEQYQVSPFQMSLDEIIEEAEREA